MTLKLQALSYGRGFGRLYAVLTFAWIIALLLLLPSYRVKFWVAPVDDSYATRVKESKAMGGLPAGYVLEHTLEWTKLHQPKIDALEADIKKHSGVVQPPVNPNGIPWEVDYEHALVKADDPRADEPIAQSRAGKSLWLLGVLIGAPLAGYLGLFGILPWIYRGFKPAHQI